MHEMGKEHVNHHTHDSEPLGVKGGNIPDHKMFRKTPKGKMKAKKTKGKKGKMKGAGKGRMVGKKDLAGMMMKWFKKEKSALVAKRHKLAKRRKMLKKRRLRLKKKRLKGHKKHHARHAHHNVLDGRKWHLIKKHNGLCKCTKHPRGRIVVSKHESQTDCENQRNGC